MAESVQNILLKITGDSSEARDELLKVARQVEQFDDTEGTATVDVNADPAERKLRDVFRELARMAREKVTAKVDADTSDAVSGIAAVSAQAEALDHKQVDVEVDVDTDRAHRGLRGFLGSLGGLFRQAGKVNNALGELSGAGFGAVAKSAGVAGDATSSFSTSVGTSGAAASIAGKAALALAAVVGPILVAAIIAAVSAVGALVASLTLAAGALGAIAVGFAALLVPAILLGVGAMERFKRTAGIAGTAANELKTAFDDFRKVFAKALAPGVGAVFRGLADALKTLGPVLTALRPAFTAFGRAVGDSVRAIAAEFARPVWVRFFRELLGAATATLPALTRLFIAVLRVTRNLVTAVLPLLAPLLDAAASAINKFARGAGSARGFQRFLAGAVPHLQLWLNLLGAIASVFLGFVKAAAPAGKELMQFLTEGARSLSKWVNSADGQEQIKAFFADTLPLVKQFAKFLGVLVVIGLQLARAVAPALAGIFQIINFGLGVVAKLLGVFNSLPAVIRGILFPFAGLAGLLSALSTVIGNLIPALRGLAAALGSGLADAGKAAVDAARAIASGIVLQFRSRVSAASSAGRAVANGVRAGVGAVAGAIADTARSIVARVVAIIRGYVDNARAAGTAVFQALRNGIAAVAGAIRDAARSILTAVVTIVRSFVDNARAAGTAVFNGVRNGIAAAAGAVRDAAQSILSRVVEIVRSFVDNGRAAGEAVFNAVRNGIASVAGEIASAARNAVSRALEGLKALAGAFEAAGRALMAAFARGVLSAGQAAIDAAKSVANKVKDLLPGSEPKDPSSPLRGLGKSGEALVGNFAAGIARAAPMLAATVADAVSGLAVHATGPATGGVSAVNIPAMQPQPAAGAQFNFNGPWASGYGPQSDGQEAFARFAQLVRDRGGLG